MAILLSPGGERRALAPDAGDTFTLAELQRLVGGYIEIVPLAEGTEVMICNEEGKIRGLPLNAPATIEALRRGWQGGGDVLVGPVLLLGADELGEDPNPHLGPDAPERDAP